MQPFVQINTLEMYINAIRTVISANILAGTDTRGPIHDATLDGNASIRGKTFRLTPREQAADAIPHLSFEGLEAIAMLDAIRQERVGQVVGRDIVARGQPMSTKAAVAERQSYAHIREAMGTLHADYKTYLKRYGHEIAGETRALLEDAAALAKVASKIALETHKAMSSGVVVQFSKDSAPRSR